MTSQPDPTYIVYAPPFDIDNGGSIFLHRLVHELLAIGEQAFVYPGDFQNPLGIKAKIRHSWTKATKGEKKQRKNFDTSPDLNTPVWDTDRLPEHAIVVYTEFIPGNPLGAENVARWLMFRTGYLGRPIEFSSDEVFFKASDFSDDPSISGGAQLLQLFWTNPCYRDLGEKDRSGSCYMMRKRAHEGIEHPIAESLNVEELSHEELAKVFNRCETFYCYDDATMYSQYAALCGCDSIVFPWHYESREEWARARPIARNGVAYGVDDVEHARQTRHLLAADLKRLEAEGRESVRAFVRTTRDRFGFRPADD